jgi:transcriptional regulator with XRE-family HTH domain
VSIGEVLAETRRQAGLSLAQVSQRTCIRETIIAAIESDDYSGCGGDFYARGHIRSIARVVGADPEPLVWEYDAARLGPEAPTDDVTEPIPVIRMPPRRRPAEPIALLRPPQRRRPAEPFTPLGRHRRRRPNWATALGVVLVAGLGFAGFLLASAGHGAAPRPGAHRSAHHHAGQATHARSAPPAGTQGTRAAPTATPAAPAAPAAPAHTLTPVSATAFGSTGGQGDNSDLAHLAIDGSPATAWHTDWYTTAHFGNLYPGTGLLVDMGRPVTVTAAQITLGQGRGASLQLRVGSAPALARLRPVAHAASGGGTVQLRLTQPAHGRYVLIWFTSLPPGPGGTFRASVYGLRLEGRP